ncbi:unnamed protein product [Ectocarpus sp. 12 AP-2014]
MGLSNLVPLDFMREAELKHGRICQLAVVGFAATDLGLHLPGAEHAVSFLETPCPMWYLLKTCIRTCKFFISHEDC